MKFDLEPAHLATIEEVLKRDEEVIRYMVLKTVRENTIAQKRSMSRPARVRETASAEEGEVTPPANPEEIDKQIDALVTE